MEPSLPNTSPEPQEALRGTRHSKEVGGKSSEFEYLDPGPDLACRRREVYSLEKKDQATLVEASDGPQSSNRDQMKICTQSVLPVLILNCLYNQARAPLGKNLKDLFISGKSDICKEIGLALGLSPPIAQWMPSLPRNIHACPDPPDGSSPPWQHLGDLSPAVAKHLVGLTDNAVLLLSPAGLLYLGVEMVVPALTALLPQPALQVLGDQRPLLCAVLFDQLDDLGKGLCKARGTHPSLIPITAPSLHISLISPQP